ncbi:cAMP and cAMP-inhibited cGMP 3',5'-cyclic phosphodiesterase 10A-like [Lytechinus variegatus]|uniref:cAMP and cAMP-inhibited cGMP 3',5'-cyclic phosphodiesterase 10A-like n=1 Tax=Lytechinus variegatus TaxID=7654 RepID=UPI001BB2751A|nr:cAMP and cAMP-inhibited cGMP 3',5'-cyclic phosphodiesterase 10A-like [Lytechinus variegatus]
MSSPWKQLERRLPPLPGNSSQSVFVLNRSEETFDSISTRPQTQPGPGRPHSTRDRWETDRGRKGMAYQTGILTTPREVKRYLSENPWLVEEFVKDNYNQEDVQRWFLKEDRPKNKGEKERPSSVKEGNLLCPSSGDDIKTFLVDIVERIEEQDGIPDVLYQLCSNISTAVKADEFFLFMVGAQENSLYLCSEGEDCIQLIPFAPIDPGTNIVAHVAYSRQPVFTEDILGDERFPLGTGRDGSLAKSVLSLPLIQPNGETVAVIELSRYVGSTPFTQEEKQIAGTYFTWLGIALDKVQVCNGLMKQREFNDFLLEVSRVIFDDIVAIDDLSKHIMMFAKSLVSADRCALFLVDNKAEELYADLFDDGIDKDGKPVFVKRSQIRFPISRGIAGHVAKTGDVVNIVDAYQDPRFNRDVDVQTGYATRSILCMPIISHGLVIGVVQMINKMGQDGQTAAFDQTDESNFKMFAMYCALALHYSRGFLKTLRNGVRVEGEISLDGQITAFDQTDESNFKMFVMYCALALHYSRIYSENQQSERHLAVIQEQLVYFTTCSEQQVDRLLNSWNKQSFIVPPEIEGFEFHSRPYVSSLNELFIYMVQRLFGPSSFDLTTLARFILTVRKNYRLVPFHNFCHAFDVCHCMFMLLLHSEGRFTDEEMYGMFFGSICHDIDHRGLTNSFHAKFATPLGKLYTSSIMERHHFAMTVSILHREGHNIFSHLPLNVFKKVMDLMQEIVMSTDLTTFFPNHKELSKLIVAQSLDWTIDRHRWSIRCMCMTACDLCATSKMWPIQQHIVDCLYEEFYHQGDLEKLRGESPIQMLDRDNLPNLAQEQVQFLTNVCLPCFSDIVDMLPAAQPLLAGCKDNLLQWQLVQEGKSAAMWNVEASRVKDPQ